MKDFDFDELDKAVSSALSQNTSSDTPQSDSAQSAPADQPQSTPIRQPLEENTSTPAADTPQIPVDSFQAAAGQDLQSPPPEPVQPADQPVEEPVVAVQDVVEHDAPAEIIQPINMPPVEAQPIVGNPVVENPVADEPVQAEPAVDNLSYESESAPQLSTEPEAQVAPEASPELETSSTIVSKSGTPTRRGRFMDMVHPSADMQGSTPKPVKRTGISLNPSGALEGTVANNDVTSPLDSAGPANKPTLDSIANDNADIADNTGATNDSASDTDVVEVQPIVPETAVSAQPFIEGASDSVEKRPLGGYVNATDVASADPDVSAEASPVDTASEANNSEDEITNQIDSTDEIDTIHNQLDDDTSSFSTFSQADTQGDSETAAVEPTSTPDQPASDNNQSQPDSSAYNAGPSPFITPQYKTAEEKADSEEHGVFDTSNYHQPLAVTEAPAASKKHLIFWAILIIALFVGGGALGALYFLSLN